MTDVENFPSRASSAHDQGANGRLSLSTPPESVNRATAPLDAFSRICSESPPEFPKRPPKVEKRPSRLLLTQASFTSIFRERNKGPPSRGSSSGGLSLNLFSNAEPSGHTPIATPDRNPLEEVLKSVQSLNAEQKPTLSSATDTYETYSERAEFVDPEAKYPYRSPFGRARPRGTFSQAKDFFLNKDVKRRATVMQMESQRVPEMKDAEVLQRSATRPNWRGDGSVGLDYLEVEIPHITFDSGLSGRSDSTGSRNGAREHNGP